MSLKTNWQRDIRGHILPMIVGAGEMGERRGGPSTAMVDGGGEGGGAVCGAIWKGARKNKEQCHLAPSVNSFQFYLRWKTVLGREQGRGIVPGRSFLRITSSGVNCRLLNWLNACLEPNCQAYLEHLSNNLWCLRVSQVNAGYKVLGLLLNYFHSRLLPSNVLPGGIFKFSIFTHVFLVSLMAAFESTMLIQQSTTVHKNIQCGQCSFN